MLLVGAIAIAAVTAIMARNMFSSAGAPEAQAQQAAPVVPAGPEVLVATRALPVGTIIDPEALKFQVWPAGLVEPAYFIKGQPGTEPASLIGTVVRNEITAGQPLTTGALIKPGERGFLAAALGPGMRAVTVAVSATSGVAGFVFPGDRVDMMLTRDVAGGGDGEPLKVTETILRNVRVLATDARTGASPGAQPTSTVTLEATPKIAEKIAVAQTMGGLSLSLRSIADNTAELERAIAAGEVTVPDSDDPKAERRMLLAIANKPIDVNPTYTTGAQVSRFARASVPPKPTVEGAPAAGGAPAPSVGAATSVESGVRIARGNNITVVPVGAK